MEGVRFTNELVKYIFSIYPRFKVKRWIYGEKYFAIENEAGYIGLTLAEPDIFKVWRDPDNLLDNLDNVDPSDLIMMLLHKNPVYKYVSHAYVNSLVNKFSLIEEDIGDPIDRMSEAEDIERVLIVGYIEPIIRRLTDEGYEVYTVEANLDMIREDYRRNEEIYPWWSIEDLLIDSDALIITGSAIPNNTIGYILSSARHIKFKVVLGPSTTLVREPFRKYGVNYLGGSIALNSDKIFDLLSKGFGFHELEKHNLIRKVTIKVR